MENRFKKMATTILLIVTLHVVAFATPVVTNVRAAQRTDGSGIVDIMYDLGEGVGEITVTLDVSNDGGSSWAVNPRAQYVTGDIGAGIENGVNKHIIWDMAADRPGVCWPETRFRVTANEETQIIDGPEMVSVPAGSFLMGRPYEYERWGDLEVPVHMVTLDAYRIGKYPVTNQEYADVLNWAQVQGYLKSSEGSVYTGGLVYAYGQPIVDTRDSESGAQIIFSGGTFSTATKIGYNDQHFSMALHPVLYVSWYGAVAFCNWLSEKNGLAPCYNTANWTRWEPVRNGFRLPTEAEWERAAAWDGSRHWRYGNYGDSLTDIHANIDMGWGDEYDWYSNAANPLRFSSYPYTTPVGWYNGVNPVNLSTPAILTVNSSSPVGTYDMAGNVFEWCHDKSYREYTAEAITNPSGPTEGSSHIIRGGSWMYPDFWARTAFRHSQSADRRSQVHGFRVSRKQ